ncbi:hypothetical protein OQA88_7538 [Cercophora sp. LCS_1]
MMFISLAAALAASPVTLAMPVIKGMMLHSSAALTLNFELMQITNVTMNCTRPDSHQDLNCGVKFDWFDPNSVRENKVSSTTCNQTWSWDGKHTIGGDDNALDTPYLPCWQSEEDGTYFAMRLMTFVGPTNFTLQLSHQYKDSENFTAPWDYPTTFAQPTLVLSLPEEEKPIAPLPKNEIHLFSPGPFYTEVVGVTI